jgi:malonyl CoA-acyl carrier protein transacylase
MGMDLYNSSPAARAVWNGADAHLLVAVYGFSIIEIIKDNPMEKGQAVRQRYMEMTYDTFSHPTDLQSLSSWRRRLPSIGGHALPAIQPPRPFSNRVKCHWTGFSKFIFAGRKAREEKLERIRLPRSSSN